MLEITSRDFGDVLSTKDTDLETLILARGKLCAASFQIVQLLVNDLLSTDVLGDLEAVALVGDELARRCKVDSTDKKWWLAKNQGG